MAKRVQKSIYEEYGIEGVVFILIVLLCVVVFSLEPVTSLILGAVGSGVVFLIKKIGVLK